jgi:hypothetical protein
LPVASVGLALGVVCLAILLGLVGAIVGSMGWEAVAKVLPRRSTIECGLAPPRSGRTEVE